MAAVALLGLGGCGGGEGRAYPADGRQLILESCLESSGGHQDYCDCFVEYLEENVPYDDAIEGEGSAAAIESCADEVD